MFYMVHFFGVFQAISSQKDKKVKFFLRRQGSNGRFMGNHKSKTCSILEVENMD
jgi:hypothetical protein